MRHASIVCHSRRIGLPVVLAILAIGLLMAGCTTIPEKTAALERARTAYEQAKANPDITANAPVAMDEAAKTLQKAEQAEDVEEMEHLAYLAERKTQIAVAVAEQRMAENQREQLFKETDKILLEAREREIEKAAKEKALVIDKARGAVEAKTLEAEMAREKTMEAISQKEQLEREIAELKGKKTERGIVLTLGDILFETGKDVILPGAMATIDRLVEFLKKYPNRNVLIEGHTDSVGSETYNLGLSQRRADAVRTALISRGIDPNRITTKGYGESRPVASNATQAGRQQNRRVEIIILE